MKSSSVGESRRLGIDTDLHALRHYSATELIMAGVDVRTVAGRLGHSGGGITTLRVYSAWREEADQRAAGKLSARMPARPTPVDPGERARREPRTPYEKIAARLRSDISVGVSNRSLETTVQQEMDLPDRGGTQPLAAVGPAPVIAGMLARRPMHDVRTPRAVMLTPAQLGVERIEDLRVQRPDLYRGLMWCLR